jgi:hypothetical protein
MAEPLTGDQREALEIVYAYAADKMTAGESPDAIKQKLIENGMDRQGATIVLRNLVRMQEMVYRNAARKRMLSGLLWGFVGVVIALLTFVAVQSGGMYVIAWSILAFGVAQFAQGFARYRQHGGMVKAEG